MQQHGEKDTGIQTHRGSLNQGWKIAKGLDTLSSTTDAVVEEKRAESIFARTGRD